jgi:hypothetical protein
MNSVHPIDFMESLLAEEGRIGEVQFSIYRYHPQSVIDDCTTHRVPVARLRATYDQLADGLDEQQDIAFDSLVGLRTKTGGKRHFALLDFQTTDAERVNRVAESLVLERRPPRAALVHSGRSFHLYMGELLSHADWVRFMGRILLLNTRDAPPTVDARWVGHRLMAGYSALRWSAKGRPFSPEVIRQW